MSVELTDLRVAIPDCGWSEQGKAHDINCYPPVTAAEVASACPTEVLIAVLVERGVLEREETTDIEARGGEVNWRSHEVVVLGVRPKRVQRLITEWEPVVGGVS